MKTVKNIIPIICIILLFSLFSACGSSSAGKTLTDVNVEDITTAVEESLGNDNSFVSAPESYISSFMELDVSNLESYEIKINSIGINIDEFGILKAKDNAKLTLIEKSIEEYFQKRIDSWMVEYMPEEFPKLENAEIKTIGNYVMYAILSDNGKKTAFKAFEDSLKA